MKRVLCAVVLVVAQLQIAAPGALAGTSPGAGLSATLDGAIIRLAEVGDWYCEDFSHPVIRCFSNPLKLETQVAVELAASAVDYVVIFDYTSYAGSYMYMSQDYSALSLIGWNDRISSFRALNSETGHFYTDWFYGGSGYNFCCNSLVPSLGLFDNTFSSVHRY